jgi:mono/diheme cytochrome c family protein
MSRSIVTYHPRPPMRSRLRTPARRNPRALLPALVAGLLAVGVSACGGQQTIQLSEDDPNYRGAVLFSERCGGCHTLEAAGTKGSASQVNNRERTDGPNFNTRAVDVDQTLYAIRNGGFSGAIMPENIAVGEEAQQIAEFLAEHSGSLIARPEAPDTAPGGGGAEGGDGPPGDPTP